jgi:hypothetical protein
MAHLLALILANETVADADDVNYDALDRAIDSIAIIFMVFLGLLHAVQIAYGIFFDIPLEQEAAPLQFLHVKGPHINSLSDTAALKIKWSGRCVRRGREGKGHGPKCLY